VGSSSVSKKWQTIQNAVQFHDRAQPIANLYELVKKRRDEVNSLHPFSGLTLIFQWS
jgi:plasmid maintenance system killer protein